MAKKLSKYITAVNNKRVNTIIFKHMQDYRVGNTWLNSSWEDYKNAKLFERQLHNVPVDIVLNEKKKLDIDEKYYKYYNKPDNKLSYLNKSEITERYEKYKNFTESKIFEEYVQLSVNNKIAKALIEQTEYNINHNKHELKQIAPRCGYFRETRNWLQKHFIIFRNVWDLAATVYKRSLKKDIKMDTSHVKTLKKYANRNDTLISVFKEKHKDDLENILKLENDLKSEKEQRHLIRTEAKNQPKLENFVKTIESIKTEGTAPSSQPQTPALTVNFK